MKKRIAWNKGTKGICKPNSGSFKKGVIPWSKGKKLDIHHDKQFTKGQIPWNKGLNGEFPNCKDCGAKLTARKNKLGVCNKCKGKYQIGKKHWNWKGGFPRCFDCGTELSRRDVKFCLNCRFRGERGSNWQGGITPLINKIRNCFKYRQWISDIFQKDNYTCQFCNVRGGYLEAHHKDSFSNIIEKNNIKSFEEAVICEELWNINNGQTLCIKCHRNIRRK